MRKEEAELKLKKYHAKLFAKCINKNSKLTPDNEIDLFEIIRIVSKGNGGMGALKVM